MKLKSLALLLICSTAICAASIVTAGAESTYYTYTYDYWGEEQASPNAYEVNTMINGSDFGIGNFVNPQGLYSVGAELYVCDTGNNRIVVLERDQGKFVYEKTIDTFNNDGTEDSLKSPYDCFLTEEGKLYIADYGNNRIVVLNQDLNCIQVVDHPEDETIGAEFKFAVKKIVVDDTGRIYALVESVNKGFMAFDPDGSFTGYMGANKVTYSAWDRFWKTIATEEQKDQMASFVPTEYNNIALSNDGFFMATTSVFEDWELDNGDVAPIRKLNAMGTDILIRNGYTNPIGDLSGNWGNAGGYSGPSKFVDCVTLDNDTYYLIDRVRSRIFAYDSQGNLLYAFGGPGNKEGYIQNPTAIEANNSDLFVTDGTTGTLTMFSVTTYGTKINDAIAAYQLGRYEESAQIWEDVLLYNGNYALAYIGIGRSLLRQEHYEEAMHYFKVAYDFDNYSKAFKLYRKDWIEANIGYIFVLIVVVALVPLTVSSVKKLKKEVEDIE